MRKNLVLGTVLALAAVVVTSCCSCRTGSKGLANLETDDWKLIEFQGKAVEDALSVTIKFDPEKKMIYGNAPCNNFFASYTLIEPQSKKDADNIKVGPAGATRKFCPNAEIENGFTMALPSIVKLKIEGDKLLMINGEGTLVALFVAVPKVAE